MKDWLLAKTERREVLEETFLGWSEACDGDPFRTPPVKMVSLVRSWETIDIEGMPLRRRFRIARNYGLLAMAVAALFWGVWWIIAGDVPTTTGLTLAPIIKIVLPFAVSRLWDVPAAFAWMFVWIFVISYWSQIDWLMRLGNLLAEVLHFGLTVGLAMGLLVGLIAGLTVGLYAGLSVALIAVLIFGLVFGLTTGLPAGLDEGLIAGLAAGLFAGLAFVLTSWLLAGLAYGLGGGLAPALPLTLLAVPLIGLCEYAIRCYPSYD